MSEYGGSLYSESIGNVKLKAVHSRIVRRNILAQQYILNIANSVSMSRIAHIRNVCLRRAAFLMCMMMILRCRGYREERYDCRYIDKI